MKPINSFLIIVLLAVLPLSSFAQSTYMKRANSAIAAGNYQEALTQLNAEKAYLKSKKVDQNSKEFMDVEKLIPKLESCASLVKSATSIMKKYSWAAFDEEYVSYSSAGIFNARQLENIPVMADGYVSQLQTAKRKLQQVVIKCPSDKKTKSKIETIEKTISDISHVVSNREEYDAWKEAASLGGYYNYADFLKKYPDGYWSESAKTAIHETCEAELWYECENDTSLALCMEYRRYFPRGEYIAEVDSIYNARLAAKEKIMKEKLEAQRKSDYKKAISSGLIPELRSYASRYPNENTSLIFLDYSNGIDKLSKSQTLSSEEVRAFSYMGRMFRDNGDAKNAISALDIAISYADSEAMYLRAMFEDLALDERVTLIAISEAGGYSQAGEELQRLAEDFNNGKNIYLKDVAAKYFSALAECGNNLDKSVFILSNSRKFPHNEEALVSRIKKNLQKIGKPNASLFENIDDGRLYLAALTLDDKEYSRQFMDAAARKGNVDASLWIEHHFGSKNKILTQCYEGFIEGGHIKETQDSYASFLKGEKIDAILQNFLSSEPSYKGNLNENSMKEQDIRFNELLSISFYLANIEMVGDVFYNDFKKVLEENNRWDSDVVRNCIDSINPYGSHNKQLRRKLSKLQTLDGIYNREENIFYQYVLAGYFDNRHKNKIPGDRIYIGNDKYSKQIDSYSYYEVEEKPKFKGKISNEFNLWVNQHLIYPEVAKERGNQGTVKLQFTIYPDGSLRDVRVLNGVSPEIDKEAVRVVSMSPRWVPGTYEGKNVSVVVIFSIIFQLR